MQQLHHLSVEPDAAFGRLFDALHSRYTCELRLPEIRRALQALSTIYVQRRDKLAAGQALHSAGKRAAFALYYGPLHLLCLRGILSQLPLPHCRRLVDVGCGTGAASLAYLQQLGAPAELWGIDTNAWVRREAANAWRLCGAQGGFMQGRALHQMLGPKDTALCVPSWSTSCRRRHAKRCWSACAKGCNRRSSSSPSRRARPLGIPSGSAPSWHAAAAATSGTCGRVCRTDGVF
ncbi:MAG: hypothetical protein EOO40_11175 [Deltaproteobacteria bacterium]|nr:MAG: hypothetical protein EOO40_11175 [Deltaproteobacteria bacterium]